MPDIEIDAIITNLENFIQQKEDLKKSHPLKYLFWESTLRCNLSCLHCGSDCVRDSSTEPDEIEAETIKRELKSISEKYDPRSITFAIIGGEPLVRPDIINVGAYAAELRYNWGITTNAMLLNEEKIKELKVAGLNTISVSLDGLEEEHNKLRNHSSSYNVVINNLKLLLDDRFYSKMDVICCVSKVNINKLDLLINKLIDLRVPALRFVPIFSHGRASEHPELTLDGDDYLKLFKLIAHYRESQKDITINLGEEGYWGPQWECVIRDRFHYCSAGISVGSILYNGDVMGCPSSSRNFIEGNIKGTSFLDLWETKFHRYRQGKKELFNSVCKDCQHWELCEGGGFHVLDQDNSPLEQCSMRKIKAIW
ncbi:MAG: radical SAM protein [Calditrichaeota bacterium]|nr:radical SAM protein [Calditrichota bacterium]